MAATSRKPGSRASRNASASAAPAFGDRKFDARPDRLDLRDLPYRPPLNSLPPRFPDDGTIRKYLSSYVREKLILDQGTEGACTGFGLACVVNYLLWVAHAESGSKARFQQVSPRMLYEMAKRYDEWPGQDYEGSSCRGALKGWHKHGVCSAEKWPYRLSSAGEPVFVRPTNGWEHDSVQRPLGVYYRINRDSVVDLQAAVVDIGAVYVSADVHDGWDELLRSKASAPARGHAGLPLIPPPKDPKELGGHAFAIVGYNERGFVVQNSWGMKWGAAGFGILPYDDWVEHATDAWACALGVPLLLPSGKGMRSLVASRWPIASGRSLTRIESGARNPDNPPDDPWPLDRVFEHKAYHPWSTDAAYAHALVSGNDGKLVVSDLTRPSSDASGHAEEILVEHPMRWLRSQGGSTLKLALYAHGGLNNEQESISRIRVLAPYFSANGIYPLFVTWKTGAGETLKDLVQDWARKALGVDPEKAAGLLEILGDAKDRAIEALGRVLGKGIWSEMRENAEFGKLRDHVLDLTARNLGALSASLAARNQRLELHLIGHSAGSILLGHLLEQMARGDVNDGPALAVKTCTLYAAACSSRFAVEKYLPAAKAGILDLKALSLYYLTDQNEKRDGLPTPGLAAYGKSLLYLVSRALDDVRKTPLLGMERALDPKYAKDSDQWADGELHSVQEWQAQWKPKGLGIAVAAPTVRNTRQGGQVQSTHGSFDNNIEALTRTLQTIAGKELVAPMEWLDY